MIVLSAPLTHRHNRTKAIQRAHRIGQTRPVRAVRFIVRKSIEERMHELCEMKRKLMEGVVDNSGKAMAQLSKDDLRFLFTR